MHAGHDVVHDTSCTEHELCHVTLGMSCVLLCLDLNAISDGSTHAWSTNDGEIKNVLELLDFFLNLLRMCVVGCVPCVIFPLISETFLGVGWGVGGGGH